MCAHFNMVKPTDSRYFRKNQCWGQSSLFWECLHLAAGPLHIVRHKWYVSANLNPDMEIAQTLQQLCGSKVLLFAAKSVMYENVKYALLNFFSSGLAWFQGLKEGLYLHVKNTYNLRYCWNVIHLKVKLFFYFELHHFHKRLFYSSNHVKKSQWQMYKTYTA